MEQVMQTVLVDIYNYCHRNKALARQNLSMGSISSNDTNVMIRQVSTDSNNEYECIVTEDVFHPEGGKQTVTPFSPVYTDPKEVALKFPLQFKENDDNTNKSTSIGINAIQSSDNQPTPTTEQELISAISSSPPSIPKETGVHILNKPPLSSSERRANRFSVTKIFDSIVNHATGVSNKLSNASMENKAKKQMIPKDEMSKSTNNDVISNIKINTKSAATEPITTSTSQQLELINIESEPTTSLSLDCSTPLPNGNEMCINSPIEIIEVDENHHILDSTSRVVSSDEITNIENKSDVIDNDVNDDNGVKILVTENDSTSTTTATSNSLSDSITANSKKEGETESSSLNNDDFEDVDDTIVEVQRVDVVVERKDNTSVVESEPLDLSKFKFVFFFFL